MPHADHHQEGTRAFEAAHRLARERAVTAVLMAGGASTRMGRDKGLLPFPERPLAAFIWEQLTALFPRAFVVSNAPDRYAFLGATVVPDLRPGCGALGGVLTALVHGRGAPVLIWACDMPWVCPPLVVALLERCGQHDVVMPFTEKGPQPFAALYGPACASPVRRCLDGGRRRIISFLGQVRAHRLEGDELREVTRGASDPFFNVNTPADYETALALLSASYSREG